MRIHPVAGFAALLFVLAGIGIAWRGERRAKEIEQNHAAAIAALPDRAREMKAQLSNPSLDAEMRKRLENRLADCERGVTRGTALYHAGNERLCGYGVGIGLIMMGWACFLYKPKVKA